MAEIETQMTPLQKAEVYFLKKVRDVGGVTIREALTMQLEDPEFNLGTGVDALDVVSKFLSLGYLEFQAETGKFLPTETNPTEKVLQ